MTNSGLGPPASFKLQQSRAYKTARKRGAMTLGSSSKSNGLGGRLAQIGEFFDKVSDLVQQGNSFLGGQFSVTGLFQSIMRTAQTLYTFDWNISDKEIQESINSSLKNLAVMTAGSFGQSVGWALCGALPGQVITKFDTALSLQLARKAGLGKIDPSKSLAKAANDTLNEEMLDELSSTYANLFNAAYNTSVKVGMLTLYRETRTLLKNTGIAERLLGKEKAEKWGADDAPPLTMAGQVEKQIEKIPEGVLRDMVEEFLEELWEGCTEALMVLGSGMDSWLAYQRSIQNREDLGPVRTVTIKPHPDSSETIKLTAQEELLKPAMSQAIAQYQLIANRDIGDVIAMPSEEHTRRSPRELSIIIEYSCYEGGVTSVGGKVSRYTPSYTVPIERSKLDWSKIKAAAGGNNGYVYGPDSVMWELETSTGAPGGQMRVYAASHKEAEERLAAFLSLSDYKMVRPVRSSEAEGGRRSQAAGNIKERVRVYPAFFKISYKRKTEKLDKGRQQLNQKDRMTTRRSKIPLWPSSRPDDFEQRLSELLSAPN